MAQWTEELKSQIDYKKEEQHKRKKEAQDYYQETQHELKEWKNSEVKKHEEHKKKVTQRERNVDERSATDIILPLRGLATLWLLSG